MEGMNIVFDIGGTNMRVASAEGEKIGEVRKVPTPQDYDETISVFASIAKELVPGGVVKAAGCIAAQIDAERGIYDAANRLHWNDRHLDTDLAAAIGAPVIIGNDCAVIGLGENMRGGGRGTDDMSYVTVSTGVGAAHIKGGQMMPFDSFFFGHTLIDGVEIEKLISGTAIRTKFGIEPKDLDSIEERNALADILAKGLVQLCVKWSPTTIVLGGSMIVGQNPIPLDRAAATLATLMTEAPILRMAELKDEGGLIGGAILAAR
jgi:predicted NBD/HSP70 family sugar kinase